MRQRPARSSPSSVLGQVVERYDGGADNRRNHLGPAHRRGTASEPCEVRRLGSVRSIAPADLEPAESARPATTLDSARRMTPPPLMPGPPIARRLVSPTRMNHLQRQSGQPGGIWPDRMPTNPQPDGWSGQDPSSRRSLTWESSRPPQLRRRQHVVDGDRDGLRRVVVTSRRQWVRLAGWDTDMCMITARPCGRLKQRQYAAC
jgi:hypothetical protein